LVGLRLAVEQVARRQIAKALGEQLKVVDDKSLTKAQSQLLPLYTVIDIHARFKIRWQACFEHTSRSR